MSVTYPTDYAWSTWTLTYLYNFTTYIDNFTTANSQWDFGTWDFTVWDAGAGITSGTAESPNIDLGAANVAYVVSWQGGGLHNAYAVVQYKTAATEAGLSSASYTTIRNGNSIIPGDRKRWIKLYVTLSLDGNLDSWGFNSITVTTAPTTKNLTTDTAGFNTSSDGARPTKDGRFLGRYYTCSLCSAKRRRYEMVKQRGRLVCRSTCKDKTSYKNRG